MEISEKNVNCPDEMVKQEGRGQRIKKDYAAPSLKSLGRLNTMTLGGSTGVSDSGTSTTFKPPPLQ